MTTPSSSSFAARVARGFLILGVIVFAASCAARKPSCSAYQSVDVPTLEVGEPGK